MQNLMAIWTTLDVQRRIILLVVGAGMLGLLVLLGRMATMPGMALLYAGLEDSAAGEVLQALDARAIRYELRGDTIFVPINQRDQTRLLLASVGLPANTHAGYELLQDLSGFGTTSQMFDAAYWRAKEGELARTILASPHIRAARVHISQGHQSGFRREVAPSASVTVTTLGAPLSPAQARSLRFLVASAVAGMSPEKVSVIDGVGGLVYGAEDETMLAALDADRALLLRRNVERLLEAHVGHGRAVVEVSIETRTEREVIQERKLDPDSRVAISTEAEENTSNSTDSRRQAVTVASNLPDGDAAARDGAAEAREAQARTRTNFEISETRREIERAPGGIERMTVAVLLDGLRETSPDGAVAWRPRPQAELDALTELVASAVGLNPARGDVITLRSLEFEPVAAQGTEARSNWFSGSALDLTAIIMGVVLLSALLILALFVLRPLLLGQRRQLPQGQELLAPVERASEPAGMLASAQEAPPEPDDDPVQRLRHLIETRGDASVHVLRHWMDERREPS